MRTLKIGATAPALRFYIADGDGPLDLDTGVTDLNVQSLGPSDFSGALTPDAGQTDPAPADGLTGVGWASISPPSTLAVGRYAVVVERVTNGGTEFYPEQGYEVLTIEPGRRTFAALSDMERRMGQTYDPPDQVLSLLEGATDLVVGATGKTAEWGQTVEPVPDALRIICQEAVARVLNNPSGASSTQEQLGAYSHTESYGGLLAGGLMLTDAERRDARRAVYGTNRASVHAPSGNVVAAIVNLPEPSFWPHGDLCACWACACDS